MTILDQLRTHTRNSPFNRSCYQVNVELSSIYRNMHFYAEDIVDVVDDNFANLVQTMTPAFQRTNDKWSYARKVKFIENLISGYPTEITLYTTNPDGTKTDCKIIDGLQRSTTIAEWFDDKITIFGKWKCSDFNEIKDRSLYMDSRITLKVHEFATEEEAVQWYIDVNEGITHSEDDIKRARGYLEGL